MSKFYIYVHVRLDTGTIFYVGKGSGKRQFQTSNRNTHWKNIVAKAGGFDSYVLADSLTEEVALSEEIALIDKYKTAGISLCNQTNGGDGTSGYRHTESVRLNMSVSRKGRATWNVGKKTPAETIEKLRVAKLGKKQTPEHIAKAAASRIGKSPSDETRRKIAASNTGKRHPEHVLAKTRKPVICLDTGVIYKGVSIAARELSLETGNISKCCKGMLNKTGGVRWSYVGASA